MQMPEHNYLILNFLVVNAYPRERKREREAHLVGVNGIKIKKLSNYYVRHVIINSSTTTYYSLTVYLYTNIRS